MARRETAHEAARGAAPLEGHVPVRRAVESAQVMTVRNGARLRRRDNLAGEEPMQIRAGSPAQEPVDVAVTMRTPGHDFELAAGFLFSEGLIGPDDVIRVSYCDDLDEEQRYNVVTVRLSTTFVGPARSFYGTSSCGICGKSSLDQVSVRCAPITERVSVSPGALTALPDELRKAQRVFSQTGGLHAAGLFTPDRGLHAVREDVGRHNAVDKLIGLALLAGVLPLAGRILLVSGRAGFEIVQKAAVAGVPIVAAVSAPSSLAVSAADRFGITLVGFLRGSGFNIYTHADRVLGGAGEG